jgi:glycerol-1-phosphate dehydrogenase [NAD(P)+]
MQDDFDIGKLAGGAEPCPCGREHPVSTKKILIGPGTLAQTGEVAKELGFRGIGLIVADGNTWEAAGAQAEAALTEAGFQSKRFVFPKGELHLDEHTAGSILMELDDAVGFLVAVGSGTINDSTRLIAKRTGLPYFVVGTAPSMDGYASPVTPAVRGGFKATLQGVPPLAVIGDTDVLKNAPLNMMAAGFGDVFGKVTARLDWLMMHRVLGEYRCPRIAAMMAEAVDECMSAAPRLSGRDGGAVEGLMKGLVLAGVAMQMAGSSLPASGAEHHIAHFFEMQDMARGRRVTLHGDKVGMAELIVMRLYEKFFTGECPVPSGEAVNRETRESQMRRDLGSFGEILIAENCSANYYTQDMRRRALEGIAAQWDFFRKEAAAIPKLRTDGEAAILSIGGPVRPRGLGYSREDTLLALKYAMELRDKFTILRLAQLSGRLEGLAEELADEFC